MEFIRPYLTSLEPDISQTICSQSIGGYCSNSLLYPEASLLSTVGLYSDSFNISTPPGGLSEWMGKEYINIGNEVIKVSPISHNSISVAQRGYNGISNMHINGDIVRLIESKDIFNNSFNSDYKQYRCIAFKNDSSLIDPSGGTPSYDISFFIKQNSRNENSVIKIALEQPSHQYLLSSSTRWSEMQIIDSSLIGVYADNYFKDSYLKVVSGSASGQGRLISSFDSLTGAITFYSSFSSSYDFSQNVDYEILPSPAQRISTGTVSPVVGESVDVTNFFNADESSPLRFVSEGSVYNFSDLSPNDIIYMWMERTLVKGRENFDVNNIIINVQYRVSG